MQIQHWRTVTVELATLNMVSIPGEKKRLACPVSPQDTGIPWCLGEVTDSDDSDVKNATRHYPTEASLSFELRGTLSWSSGVTKTSTIILNKKVFM